MIFKAQAEPMLAEWQLQKAKERIGAKPIPQTAEQTTKAAKEVLRHARNIERVVGPKK